MLHKRARRKKRRRKTTFQSYGIQKIQRNARSGPDRDRNSHPRLYRGRRGGEGRGNGAYVPHATSTGHRSLSRRPSSSFLTSQKRQRNSPDWPTDRISTRNTSRPRTTCPPRGERVSTAPSTAPSSSCGSTAGRPSGASNKISIMKRGIHKA